MEGVCQALRCAHISIADQTLPSEHVCGSVFDRKSASELSNHFSATLSVKFHELKVEITLSMEGGAIGVSLQSQALCILILCKERFQRDQSAKKASSHITTV